MLLVAAAVIVGACSDDADEAATTTTAAEATTTTPVETDTAPSTTVESEPELLVGGDLLDGGTSYRTSSEDEDLQVRFTIPEEQGEDSWNALAARQASFIILAEQDEPTPGVPADFSPGVQATPISPDATVDDVVATMTAYASDNDEFDVEVESGELGGEEVTVLRGSSSAEHDGLVEVPTSSGGSFFQMPTGPREFLVYVIEGPSQLFVAVFDSHELDFDLMVERAVPILDSIEIG